MMEDLPNIIVVSCSNTKPKSLIKLITKEIPKENNLGLFFQTWKIDTKYYNATVNFIGLDETCLKNLSEEFKTRVEAFIIHFDSNKTTGLDDLKQWEIFEKTCDADVKLLVSNYCTPETKITKPKAIDWCLKHGFEFIELYPTDTDSEEPEQDIIREKFGANRIIEALEAHTWSNLVMKPKNDAKKSQENKNEILRDDVDEFTELFSQLHMMKDSLQSMPNGQRKQCAEQMVTAFWNAIGGEEEELLDL